jgi:hypothetical protein
VDGRLTWDLRLEATVWNLEPLASPHIEGNISGTWHVCQGFLSRVYRIPSSAKSVKLTLTLYKQYSLILILRTLPYNSKIVVNHTDRLYCCIVSSQHEDNTRTSRENQEQPHPSNSRHGPRPIPSKNKHKMWRALQWRLSCKPGSTWANLLLCRGVRRVIFARFGLVRCSVYQGILEGIVFSRMRGDSVDEFASYSTP